MNSEKRKRTIVFSFVLFFLFATGSGDVKAAFGDVITSWGTPGSEPRGLTWDGGAAFWLADSGSDMVYSLDASGGENLLDSKTSMSGDPYGMAYDGGMIWNVDGTNGNFYADDSPGRT